MPNKRNPNRRAFGIALNIETLELLKAEAKKQGTNISNLLENLTIEKYGKSKTTESIHPSIKKSNNAPKKRNEK